MPNAERRAGKPATAERKRETKLMKYGKNGAALNTAEMDEPMLAIIRGFERLSQLTAERIESTQKAEKAIDEALEGLAEAFMESMKPMLEEYERKPIRA